METDYVMNTWACIERVIVTAIREHEKITKDVTLAERQWGPLLSFRNYWFRISSPLPSEECNSAKRSFHNESKFGPDAAVGQNPSFLFAFKLVILWTLKLMMSLLLNP
jgi:hypothetical protein